MHFTKLSVALLGLAAFASAVPHQLEAGNVERGLTWTPRSLKERSDIQSKNQNKGNGNTNNKDSVTIIDTTIIKLNEQSKNSEVELIVLVQEEIKSQSEKKAKDNLRKNHFRNKNKDVNTVIIVITEIIDIRDSKNQNKRYMRHQLRADNKQRKDVTIQITEIVAITISADSKGGNGKGNGKESQTTGGAEDKSGKGVAATAASDAAAAAIQTVDANAPYASNNQTMILPSGAPAPSSSQAGSDPAAIMEDGFNGMFVQAIGS